MVGFNNICLAVRSKVADKIMSGRNYGPGLPKSTTIPPPQFSPISYASSNSIQTRE